MISDLADLIPGIRPGLASITHLSVWPTITSSQCFLKISNITHSLVQQTGTAWAWLTAPAPQQPWCLTCWWLSVHKTRMCVSEHTEDSSLSELSSRLTQFYLVLAPAGEAGSWSLHSSGQPPTKVPVRTFSFLSSGSPPQHTSHWQDRGSGYSAPAASLHPPNSNYPKNLLSNTYFLLLKI